MRDASMEQINLLDCEETEIDLCQCIKLVAKHKKAFIGVFLFVLGIGLWCFLSSPEIYRISVLLYPSTINEVLSSGNDSKSAKDLEDLIINNSFNRALRKKLNLDPNKNNLEFNVAILDKSKILQVGIDLDSKEKESGVAILQNLSEIISESYAKRFEIESANIVSKVKLKERAIMSAKEKAKSLKEQIREAAAKEDKISKKKDFIITNTAQILGERERLLKISAAIENSGTLFLANQIKDNSSYLKWANKQLSELSLRKEQLGLELKNINSQINNLQMEIDKLDISKDSIPSLRILSQPKVSPTPVNSKKIKNLGLFITIGLLSGLLAVFLQESRKGKQKR